MRGPTQAGMMTQNQALHASALGDNLSCLIHYGKSSLISKTIQLSPFQFIDAFMVCLSLFLYESSVDVYSCIIKQLHVHMYDLIPCVITYMFCLHTDKIPDTRSLRVIRIPLGERLQSNHQNQARILPSKLGKNP